MRNAYAPNDLTIKRVAEGVWDASVTLRVDEKDGGREHGNNMIRGVHQGLTERIVFDDGEKVENPRRLREELCRLERFQQCQALPEAILPLQETAQADCSPPSGYCQ